MTFTQAQTRRRGSAERNPVGVPGDGGIAVRLGRGSIVELAVAGQKGTGADPVQASGSGSANLGSNFVLREPNCWLGS